MAANIKKLNKKEKGSKPFVANGFILFKVWYSNKRNKRAWYPSMILFPTSMGVSTWLMVFVVAACAEKNNVF